MLALLWPKSDLAGFLPALSFFCRLLRHPELRARLRASATPAEAYAWIERFDGDGMPKASAGFPGSDRLLNPHRFRQAMA